MEYNESTSNSIVSSSLRRDNFLNSNMSTWQNDNSTKNVFGSFSSNFSTKVMHSLSSLSQSSRKSNDYDKNIRVRKDILESDISFSNDTSYSLSQPSFFCASQNIGSDLDCDISKTKLNFCEKEGFSSNKNNSKPQSDCDMFSDDDETMLDLDTVEKENLSKSNIDCNMFPTDDDETMLDLDTLDGNLEEFKEISEYIINKEGKKQSESSTCSNIFNNDKNTKETNDSELKQLPDSHNLFSSSQPIFSQDSLISSQAEAAPKKPSFKPVFKKPVKKTKLSTDLQQNEIIKKANITKKVKNYCNKNNIEIKEETSVENKDETPTPTNKSCKDLKAKQVVQITNNILKEGNNSNKINLQFQRPKNKSFAVKKSNNSQINVNKSISKSKPPVETKKSKNESSSNKNLQLNVGNTKSKPCNSKNKDNIPKENELKHEDGVLDDKIEMCNYLKNVREKCINNFKRKFYYLYKSNNQSSQINCAQKKQLQIRGSIENLGTSSRNSVNLNSRKVGENDKNYVNENESVQIYESNNTDTNERDQSSNFAYEESNPKSVHKSDKLFDEDGTQNTDIVCRNIINKTINNILNTLGTQNQLDDIDKLNRASETYNGNSSDNTSISNSHDAVEEDDLNDEIEPESPKAICSSSSKSKIYKRKNTLISSATDSGNDSIEITKRSKLRKNKVYNRIKGTSVHFRDSIDSDDETYISSQNSRTDELGFPKIKLNKKKDSDPKVEKIKRHLYDLQEQMKFPVWAQCDSCDKWRCLKDVEDPGELNDLWICSMNKDTKYNACSKPEQPWDKKHDKTFIYNKFTLGSGKITLNSI